MGAESQFATRPSGTLSRVGLLRQIEPAETGRLDPIPDPLTRRTIPGRSLTYCVTRSTSSHLCTLRFSWQRKRNGKRTRGA